MKTLKLKTIVIIALISLPAFGADETKANFENAKDVIPRIAVHYPTKLDKKGCEAMKTIEKPLAEVASQFVKARNDRLFYQKDGTFVVEQRPRSY